MANYFESKTSVQSMRYEFFYGINSKPMPSESPTNWAKRLSEKAENCDFEQMTQEEALALVMCRYSKYMITESKLYIGKNLGCSPLWLCLLLL